MCFQNFWAILAFLVFFNSEFQGTSLNFWGCCPEFRHGIILFNGNFILCEGVHCTSFPFILTMQKPKALHSSHNWRKAEIFPLLQRGRRVIVQAFFSSHLKQSTAWCTHDFAYSLCERCRDVNSHHLLQHVRGKSNLFVVPCQQKEKETAFFCHLYVYISIYLKGINE